MITARTTPQLLSPVVSPKALRRGEATALRSTRQDDGVTVDRRTALISGGLLASSLVVPEFAVAETYTFTIAPEKLSGPQAKQQRSEVLDRAQRAIAPVLTAADAPFAMRLLFNDAATYDYATKTGGLDGSIVQDEELNRPENAMLKPLVAKLTDVKKAIDEGNAAADQGPISWADLIVLTARVAIGKEWRVQKRKRTANDEDAAFLDNTFGADWPVKLGRVDSTTPGAAGRIPAVDASVEDIKTFLLQIGAKPEGGFGYKPPFYERPGFVMYTAAQADPDQAEEYLASDPEFAVWKANYDKSRKTITRTSTPL